MWERLGPSGRFVCSVLIGILAPVIAFVAFHFANAKDILGYCLGYLKVKDALFLSLYDALLKGEPREIIPFFDKIITALK